MELSDGKGIAYVGWYRKESSNYKNILIHANPSHTVATKRAIIGDMFRTAVAISSDEGERSESRRIASQIARSNRYPGTQCRFSPSTDNRNYSQGEDKLPLFLPFVSDRLDVLCTTVSVQSSTANGDGECKTGLCDVPVRKGM